MISRMRLRMLQALIVLVLFTCVAGPVFETFDHWDPSLATGHDTESTLVICAVCVGTTLAIGQIVKRLLQNWLAKRVSSVRASLPSGASFLLGPFFLIRISASPPILSLRI